MLEAVIEIADPIVLRKTPDGHLEVKCYQYLLGADEAISMILRFSPVAGGQLVTLIQAGVDANLIRIDVSNAPGGVH